MLPDHGSGEPWIQIHDPNGYGIRLYVFNPGEQEIILESAARACCYVTRYSGNLLTGIRKAWQSLRPGVPTENTHGSGIYSVTQHSLILSWILLCAGLAKINKAFTCLVCKRFAATKQGILYTHCCGTEIPILSLSEIVQILRLPRIALAHDLPEGCGLLDIPHPVKSRIQGYDQMEDRIWAILAKRYDLSAQIPPIVKTWDKRLVATEKRDFIGTPAGPWVQDGIVPLPLRIRPLGALPLYAAWTQRWDRLAFADRASSIHAMAAHVNRPDPIQILRILHEYTPPAWLKIQNRIRHKIGIRNMFTGRELYGVCDPGGI